MEVVWLNDKETKHKYYELLTKAMETISPSIRKRHIKEAISIIQQLEKEGRKIAGVNCPNY